MMNEEQGESEKGSSRKYALGKAQLGVISIAPELGVMFQMGTYITKQYMQLATKRNFIRKSISRGRDSTSIAALLTTLRHC